MRNKTTTWTTVTALFIAGETPTSLVDKVYPCASYVVPVVQVVSLKTSSCILKNIQLYP